MHSIGYNHINDIIGVRMMWRLIFLGLLIWLVIHILKRNIGQIKPPKNDTDVKTTNTENKTHIEDMVQCAHCAVHLPRSEAFLVGGVIYCSKAHIQNK